MPSPVRRKLFVLVLALGAALALAAVAYAGNGGFAPVTPHSPNAKRINDSYLWITIFTGVDLRRRRERAAPVHLPLPPARTPARRGGPAGPRRDAPGADLDRDSRRHPRRDRGVHLLQAARHPGHPEREGGGRAARRSGWTRISSTGSSRIRTAPISIDELHAPVNRAVQVDIHSQDVDHSWWIPALGGKFDAIPGNPTKTWFKADQVGTYRGQCGEFCGVYHAAMQRKRGRAEPARVRVVPRVTRQPARARRPGVDRRLREVSRARRLTAGTGPRSRTTRPWSSRRACGR